MAQFNHRIRQVVILSIILLLGYLVTRELYIFVPGFLGAVTLYILSRDRYFYLVYKKKWNDKWTALFFIVSSLLIIGIPLYFTIKVMLPQISMMFGHSQEMKEGLRQMSDQLSKITGQQLMTDENMRILQSRLGSFIPTFLNSTLNILANIIMAFFVLYYMYVHGKEMEEAINRFIPLHPESIDKLASETLVMVRANAIGIPLISLIQGVTATIGYKIFGLSDYGLWGFLTGVFAFFPLIGTMLIWLPLGILLYSQGNNWQATGLLIYSFIVTGNIDYVARITLMKKIGDVHPLITVLGVIVGLALFGFMGFIFGPLLLSYLILLIKIYTSEFIEHPTPNKKHEHGP